MGHPKCERDSFSERTEVAAGSQRKEPDHRRAYPFTSRKITKRKRRLKDRLVILSDGLASPAPGENPPRVWPDCDKFCVGLHDRNTLRLASPNGEARHEALDSPTPAGVAICSFRGLSPAIRRRALVVVPSSWFSFSSRFRWQRLKIEHDNEEDVDEHEHEHEND